MKMLTIMLLPIMPGFNAWAAQGFTEKNASPDSDVKPEPLSKKVLARLTCGSIPECSNVVCVPYDGVGSFIRSLTEHSICTEVRPLDRGGILLCFNLTPDSWDKLCKMIADDAAAADAAAADAVKSVSDSK